MSFLRECELGRLKYVKQLYNKDEASYGLLKACQFRRMRVIEFLISKSDININSGLFGACSGGHIDIVELMVLYGATEYSYGIERANSHYGITKYLQDLIKKLE